MHLLLLWDGSLVTLQSEILRKNTHNKIVEPAQSKAHVNMAIEYIITSSTDSSKKHQRSQLKSTFSSSFAKKTVTEKQLNKEKRIFIF